MAINQSDIIAVLRELVEDHIVLSPFDYGRQFNEYMQVSGLASSEDGDYCVYCDWTEEWDGREDNHEPKHNDACPIKRGRELLKEIELESQT